RTAASSLRELLAEHYAGEGKSQPLRILLPDEGYVPIFERPSPPRPTPVPPPPSTTAPLTEHPSPGPAKRSFFNRNVVLAAGLFVLGLGTVLWWFSHDQHCGEGMQITFPADGASVGPDEVVRGIRTPREFLCRCKDYLVVEPLDVESWFVQ